MPIIQRTNLNENTVLALWKISETKEQLIHSLGDNLVDTGLNRADNIHWLASRVLLRELFPHQQIKLQKDAHNKPSLFIHSTPYAISITHSYEYAAVIISLSNVVAIDLERIDARVLRVAHKFTREDESVESDQSVLYHTILWSAKETLYKYYGKKELDFKLHLQLLPFECNADSFVVTGIIQKESYRLVLPIHVTILDGYTLTYSVGD